MNRALLAAPILLAGCLATVGAAAASTPRANAPKCHSTAPSDFNGDGRSDTAISAPGAKDFPTTSGDVSIFTGALNGLKSNETLVAAHSPDTTTTFPAFGAATTIADFNGDHCADLVVLDDGGRFGNYHYGARGSGINKPAYGDAEVYYGHPDPDRTKLFNKQQGIGAYSIKGLGTSCNTPSGCPVNLEPVVAAGDVNGDGKADLIAATATTIDGDGLAYELSILSGSKTGLHPNGNARTIALGTKVFPGTNPATEVDELAVGDINHDGYADVAVGFTSGNGELPGVDVLYGSKKGLGLGRASQLWDRNRAGVPGSDDGGTSISIALGDFRGNGHDDLAFAEGGAPKVTVVYGTATGLTTKHIQTWSKGSPGIKGSTAAHNDVWGSTMVAGRFGVEKYDDLVVGDTGTRQISVLEGSAAHGLVAKDNQLWQAGMDGIPGKFGPGTSWSSAMSVGYYGHGLGEDLAIGAKYANNTRGTVTVLFGTRGQPIGLSTAHPEPLLKPTFNGVPAASHDEFGAALPSS